MHHIDKVQSTSQLRYSPKFNLYHKSQLIDRKLLKKDRKFTLKIIHKIRKQNISLYKELFDIQNITITAENIYGSIVGFA